jgi:hypothetical protein
MFHPFRTASVAFALIALARAFGAEPHLPPGIEPLPSAGPKGRGPLALVNLNHQVLGYARVFGGMMPDLFVAGYGGPAAVHLFRWVDTAETGAPVFALPVKVKCAFVRQGTVFQTADGVVRGLWIDKGELVETRFDRDALEFRETGRVSLGKSLGSPSNLGAIVNDDGSCDLAFEMSNGSEGPGGSTWTEEWRPFNSSGIAAGTRRYRYLDGATLRNWQIGWLGQITATRREVYHSINGITHICLGTGRKRDWVTGSHQGNLLYYHNQAATGFDLGKKRLVAGEDGNALRHPSINPSVCAYPNADGTASDLIACGEGSLYFYRFTGKFTAAGAPVFAEPASVLEENADLYAGTLPSPTTVDWNGDGALDILAGNSEGFVLFFQNTGSDAAPKFLPAIRVQAGGRDIHVQAGYLGSLQGLQESRWGYLSPNAIDWNGDGLLDLVTGDITGNYRIYLNRGTAKEPRLDPAHPLYCDGVDLHGMWRVRPALAKIGDRVAIAILDGNNRFHLYWRIDDYNVEDGGDLVLEDGQPIGSNSGPAGLSGRCKLDFFDWNQDGQLDLVIGTGRVNSIPDPETGLPMPGIAEKALGTPLLMLNTGTNEAMKFARPSRSVMKLEQSSSRAALMKPEPLAPCSAAMVPICSSAMKPGACSSSPAKHSAPIHKRTHRFYASQATQEKRGSSHRQRRSPPLRQSSLLARSIGNGAGAGRGVEGGRVQRRSCPQGQCEGETRVHRQPAGRDRCFPRCGSRSAAHRGGGGLAILPSRSGGADDPSWPHPHRRQLERPMARAGRHVEPQRFVDEGRRALLDALERGFYRLLFPHQAAPMAQDRTHPSRHLARASVGPGQSARPRR